MKKLYIPSDESELVFIKSVFEAEGIPFYVQNDNFGSLYPGAYMNSFYAKTIMVPEEYFDQGKEIISSVIQNAEFPEFQEKHPPKMSELLDSLISLITLGYYSAGNKKGSQSEDTD